MKQPNVKRIILSEPHIYYVGDTKYEIDKYFINMNVYSEISHKWTKSKNIAYSTMRKWAKDNEIEEVIVKTTSEINGQQEGIHKRWLRRNAL